MGTAYKDLFKLYDLIQNGDTRSIKKHLSETPSIELNVVLPSKGVGVLHLAVGIDPIEKSIECTELLLQHGADPNLCNEDGVTPVHIAAIWGRLENMMALVARGGAPERRDLDGVAADEYAAREEQWHVYEFLQGLRTDSNDERISYTLDLDKILVNTEDIVAEYTPMVEDNTHRKSDIVQDWCDTNSLVVNKLYPTILSETYVLDDETCPFKDTNITLDLTQTTNTTFKTCQSKKSDEISGIKPLESTTDRRKSVYNNFSLPGSPKSITHTNYKTKSSVRRSKDLVQEFTNLSLNSLISSDNSLDKAMAVVQNRTNEWLSEDVKGSNTRRSSASSGVSSNYSGGSIVLASVQHQYRYEDSERRVLLLETRTLVSPIVLPVEEASDGSPDQSVLSLASSLPTAVRVSDASHSAPVRVSDASLRAALQAQGYTPGPVTNFTRTLYLRKLQNIIKTPVLAAGSSSVQKKVYSIELQKSLQSDEWMEDLSSYQELERKVLFDFSSDNKKWTHGNAKTCFTYLLLDPRVTNNLPQKQGSLSSKDKWSQFISSIFYVGKGSRSRPYAHLYEAHSLWQGGVKETSKKKVQQILDIWNENVGVVCLHILQNTIPAEAHTYEAAIIDVLGLGSLKNMINGTYYGVAASWPHRERRMLGLYLLYKAMQIFLVEGERQLRPGDL